MCNQNYMQQGGIAAGGSCPNCGHCSHCGRGGINQIVTPNWQYQGQYSTSTPTGSTQTTGVASNITSQING